MLRIGFDGMRKLAARIKAKIVQPCPPEILACETCGKVECTADQWEHCARRLRVSELTIADEYQKKEHSPAKIG